MHKSNENNQRIVMIDALRGFALMGILFLHHIEHFNLFARPLEGFRPEWIIEIDKWIWNSLFYFFGNKSFALFSLLFGLSYWILHERAQARGERYLFRHFWRMTILASIGVIHICFYSGDILTKYALLGLPLVFVRWMSPRVTLTVAVVLLLNPLNLYAFATFLTESGIADTRLRGLSVNMTPYLKEGSFWEVLQANFQVGVLSTVGWNWNAGRVFTIPGLFFLGAFLGQIKLLTSASLKLWYRILVVSVSCWLLLDLVKDAWVMQLDQKLAKVIFKSGIKTYINLAMMFTILSVFVLVWRHNDGDVWIRKLSWFGRMGLTNYVTTSVSGAFLYYGWSLGLYRYCSTTVTFLIALFMLGLQAIFSYYWLQHHKQGPLEELWRWATWGISDRRNERIGLAPVTVKG